MSIVMRPVDNKGRRELVIPEVEEQDDGGRESHLDQSDENKTVGSQEELKQGGNTIGQISEAAKYFSDIREKNGRLNVCLTGATGFLGSHILKLLLDKETSGSALYNVSAGLSRNADSEDIEAMRRLQEDFPNRLKYRQFDMTKADECEELLKDCHAVIHCSASPRDQKAEHPINILYPEIEGVLNLLTLARKLGIKRFVLLSSVSSVAAGKFRKLYNESHWAHPDDCDDYERAKLFAERTAWNFSEENPESLSLTVFCPAMMLGPLLRKRSRSASVIFMKKLLSEKLQQVLDLKIPSVDVRDVAKVIVDSLEKPESFGQRYLLVEGVYALKELSGIINQNNTSETKGRPGYFSKLLIRVLGWFDRDLRKILEFYGKTYRFDCEKARRELGATFRPLDQSLGAMIVSMEKHELVKYAEDRVRLVNQ